MSKRSKKLSARSGRRAKERELAKINKAILEGTTFNDYLLSTKVTKVDEAAFLVEVDLNDIKFE